MYVLLWGEVPLFALLGSQRYDASSSSAPGVSTRPYSELSSSVPCNDIVQLLALALRKPAAGAPKKTKEKNRRAQMALSKCRRAQVASHEDEDAFRVADEKNSTSMRSMRSTFDISSDWQFDAMLATRRRAACAGRAVLYRLGPTRGLAADGALGCLADAPGSARFRARGVRRFR
jgi:hypothetical protein